MTDWECPNCHGGFPDTKLGECPWCGQAINGSYEYEPQVVSHVAEKRERQGGLLGPGCFSRLLERFR